MAVANEGPSVSRGAEAALRDRDVDAIPDPRPGASDRAAPLGPYQRLIANPFLAVFGTVVWFAALRATVQTKRLDLFCASLLGGLLIPCLFQFHCLDCGGTGHVVRCGGHACAHVVARRQAGTPRRFRGPTPMTQTKLWILALAATALFVLCLG